MVIIGVVPSRAARALDAFEIQVYDGTANPTGAPGLELHVNDVVRGSTRATPPELAPNHQAHFTLEPSYGVTDFWELGAYLQTALRADGSFDFAGIKARSKLVTRPSWSTTRRLGLNVEVSDVPARYEAERWGLELRPIVAQDVGRFSVVVNPIVGVPLTGGAARFEPAAEVLFAWPRLASLGLEYYADSRGHDGFLSRSRSEALPVRGGEPAAGWRLRAQRRRRRGPHPDLQSLHREAHLGLSIRRWPPLTLECLRAVSGVKTEGQR